MITVSRQLLLNPAYTDNGNKYYESNVGKFAAGTSTAGAATFYGGKYAIKGAKEFLQKPNFKPIKINVGGLPNKTSINNVVVLIANKSINFFKQGMTFAKSAIKKLDMKNIQKTGKAIVDFTKKASVQKGAGVAAGFGLILAAGFGIDAIINKISKINADKNA